MNRKQIRILAAAVFLVGLAGNLYLNHQWYGRTHKAIGELRANLKSIGMQANQADAISVTLEKVDTEARYHVSSMFTFSCVMLVALVLGIPSDDKGKAPRAK